MEHLQKNHQISDYGLSDWLSWLETRCTQPIELGLERVRVVADRLNLLKPSAPVITVAGTNGKGSTVAVLETVYSLAGYRVGSYTSPHLHVFNERIKIHKQPVTDDMICEAFSEIEEARDSIRLTYFEVTTLAALLCFKKMQVDVILLEVGMGGRLDATNIIDADLALISSIDLDHQSYLGDTKEKIGFEKAGIARSGKPLIFADLNVPNSIEQHAFNIGAKFIQLGKDYHLKIQNHDQFIYHKSDVEIRFGPVNLHEHNVAGAMTAILETQAILPVSQHTIRTALSNIDIEGRQSLLSGRVPVLMDVAHNPHAVTYLLEKIKRIGTGGRVHAVFGALKDKDVKSIISILRHVVCEWYPTLLPDSRTIDLEQLQSVFHELDIKTNIHESPAQAFDEALNTSHQHDLIVVFGSFITVSEVLSFLKSKKTGSYYELKNG